MALQRAATDRGARVGETVRRRFNYPVGVEWPGVLAWVRERERLGLVGFGAARDLSRTLQRSDVSRFMTYEFKMEGERGRTLCLNGPDGDFRVEIEHDLARVRIMGERVWFVDERARGEVASRVREGDIVHAGSISGRAQREVLALLYALVRALAGATGVFHDEARRPGGWDDPAGDPFSGRSYDVYVRNGHTGPYLLSLDNITLHVNRDAEPADWEGFGSLPAPAAGAGV